MPVPYTFANQTGAIPLSELDANFASVPNLANTAGTVTNNAQPNITSVGVLNSLSVTGNIETNILFQNAPFICLGANAGFSSNIDTISIGNSAGGSNNQGSYAIAIGSQAGANAQGINGVSIGGSAGISNQGNEAVALGFNAGRFYQGGNAVALGRNAGNSLQGESAVAVGRNSGNVNQGANAVSVGRNAGNVSQGVEAVAVGHSAGNTTQGNAAVAIGWQAGYQSQSQYAVAIGAYAGNLNQGANSIAIGSFAGYPSVANNAVVLNGDTVPLDAPNSGLYIAPIRNDNTNVTNTVYYNTTTKELTYSIIAGSDYGNANVANYLPLYGGNLFSLNSVCATGNITVDGYFLGDGSLLTGINASNIVGSYSNANVAAYLPTYTGNVTANYFIGNGSQLTGIGSGTKISNGNSSVNIATPGSNIVLIVGNTQSATFFTTGMSLPGNLSVSGNIIANNFVGGGAGSPTISAATNLTLSAAVSVQVTGGGTFRLPSLTTAAIANLIPVNGDIIYNSSVNKFQGYENGAWGNLI